MRISISGCANSGKSTLLNAFKNRWPMYSTPQKTYRDVIREANLNHSSMTSDETQLMILDWMMSEQKKYPKDSKVIYDRCPWDNLVYTLHGNAKGIVSDEVAAATISFAREAMKDVDIIFWLKYNPSIRIVNDGIRDANPEYIKETDEIFGELFHQYMENLESDVFYPKEDCPAIIAIDEHFTSVDDKLMFIGEFLDHNGNLIETENSILDPSNMDLLEQMVQEQIKEMDTEKKISNIFKNIQ